MKMSKHLWLRAPRVLAALLAAGLVVTGAAEAAYAKSSRTDRVQHAGYFGKDISLRVVNNSTTTVSAAFCANGHISLAYQVGTRSDPCSYTPEVYTLEGTSDPPNGTRRTYGGNPIGVIVRGNGKTLYFYVKNPDIGAPFFEVNGTKVEMSIEGELVTRYPDGCTIRFHREGDTDVKNMTIEIIKM